MAKYHMVKSKLEIKEPNEIKELLLNGKYATVSMCRNNEPYIVTLSYGYDPQQKVIYFHCAKRGLKIDFIRKNPKVCGTVVEDLGYLNGDCDHKFRSVVFWGRVTEVDDPEEVKHAYDILIGQLENQPEVVKARIFAKPIAYKRALVLRLAIEDITGKRSMKV